MNDRKTISEAEKRVYPAFSTLRM